MNLQSIKTAVSSRYAKVGAGLTAMVASAGAMATETTPAQQAFTTLQTQASEFAGYAWPVVTGVVGALLAIGLFKKFANKAS